MVEKTKEQLLAEAQARAENLKIEKEAAETRAEQLEIEGKIAESLREQAKLMFELSDKSDSAKEFYRESLKVANEMEKARKKELEVINKSNEALKEQEKIQNSLGDAVGGLANKWRGGILESILDTGVNTEHLSEQMAQLVNPINIAGTAISAVVQSTAKAVAEASNLRAEYIGATGDIAGFSENILEGAAVGAASFGVGMQEANKSFLTLRDSMSTFTSESPELQKRLTQSAASFENLGVSSAEFGKNLQTLQMSFGMTGEQALSTQQDFSKMATGIGIPLNQLSKDFAANGAEFAAYGDAGIEAFTQLAKVAKQTGLEMGTLLGITRQFDTFEGAANAAGQLNTILGGPLVDSMQLLTASDEERVRILQQSVDASGKSFDSMSRLEKMALANAGGFKSVADAAAVFSDKAKAMRAETEGLGASQEELQKVQQGAVSLSRKFTLIMEQLAVAVGPIITGMDFLATKTLEFLDYIKETFPNIGGFANAILLFGGAFLVLKLGISLARRAFGLFTSDATESSNRISNLFRQVGDSIKSVGKGIGKAIKGIAQGIGGAIKVIFQGLGSGIASLLGAMGRGMSAMLMPLANPAVMVGAAVFAGVMLSIGLAAAGIGYMVTSFKELFTTIMDNAKNLPEAMKGIMSLAGTFTALAGSIGLLAMSMYAISAASLVIMLPAMGAAVSVGLLALSFGALAASAKIFAESMKALGSEGGVTEFVSVVKSIDDANIDNLEKIMDEADRMVLIQAKLTAMDAANSISNAVDRLVSLVTPDGSGANERRKREVVLEMNGREFGRAVVEALDDDMKLSLA